MPTGSDITTNSISNNSIHSNDKIITANTATSRETATMDTAGTNGATNGNSESNCGTKLPTGTYDPTPYIQRARVTRPAPPKPSVNPMQFVQIKPCNLYQTAQDQLKRAEEVKKVKEIKKEEPEDWQNNLDNWKSSRRKRVEHIIDRVVEVKKLELEEHGRTRRKSKTFSEMLEERGERKGRINKLASLTVYTEDEANDLSDLGIGTSSASGKSSLSEDYDNHSVSVNEAIEMALHAIDQEETSLEQIMHQEKPNENQSLATQMDISQTIAISKTEPIYENIEEKITISVTETLRITEQPDLLVNNSIPDDPVAEDHTTPSEIPPETTNQSFIVPGPTAQARKSLIHSCQDNIILDQTEIENEPYYQVPKSSEPYYEVPKSNRTIPVYENIELFYNNIGQVSQSVDGILDGGPLINTSIPPMMMTVMQPPKEKPPPPPVDNLTDDEDGCGENTYEIIDSQKSSPIKMSSNMEINGKQRNDSKPVKRMNSTKRIKKEMRNKRSSFLGIEGSNDDDSFLELSLAPPPDMMKLLQEERRLEKQLYMKAGLYDSSDTGESRDSGVSENHSRQSSEPFTNSSEEHVDLLKKKEKEIIEVLEREEEKQKLQSTIRTDNWVEEQPESTDSDTKIHCIEEQIREQEELLRVERELLQLEQEELKRQRENLMIRENLARHELEHGAKMLMSANRRSLQDINASAIVPLSTLQQPSKLQHTTTQNHYANVPNQIYQVETDYRKSMSDLQDFSPSKRLSAANVQPPIPPAKPLRSHLSLDNGTNRLTNFNASVPGGGLVKIANRSMLSSQVTPTHIQHSQSIDEYVPLRNYQTNTTLHPGGNMTRNTLLALSATPKPKFTDAWVQSSKKPTSSVDKAHESWLYQQKRKSVPEGFNYNKHWLIQEAEQRRIDQQRGLLRASAGNGTNRAVISGGWCSSSSSAIQRNGNSDNKPLPDAVIQTITQRVQSKGIGERKRLEARSTESLITTVSQSNQMLNSSIPQINSINDVHKQQDKILSVSGRKKCSHCGDELGRGAAMIIESLRLFYHINCFKCCVCHVQLGDGLNGTDVRVRNHKLHCHNCYSSDDGIKFSCV